MKTLTKRILLTVFGIPAFLSTIFFFPHENFLLFSLVSLMFSILGSYEMHALITKTVNNKPILHPLAVGLFPAAMYLQLYVSSAFPLVEMVYLFSFLLILLHEVVRGVKDNFAGSLNRVSLSTMHLFYPSALCMFVIRMTAFNQANLVIIFFFLMIFMNDVFAYVAGMLFGKSTRGIVAVSPKKSMAGFIGGFAVALLMGWIYYSVASPLHSLGSAGLFLTIAGITALGADLGDLAESVLKRSSQMKDSGTIIPGRGGVLDTIDSIVFAAPLFYFACILFLKV